MNTEPPPEWSNGPVRRPVDMSDSFKKEGWEYCRVLITDPRSDVYLKEYRERSKLETPQQEGGEEDSQTSSSPPSEGKT